MASPKCEIALAQGKKSWDRRQDERDKEARREAEELCIATGGDNAVMEKTNMQITLDTKPYRDARNRRARHLFI